VKASRADREAIAKGADPNVVASGAIARGARAQIDQQGDEEAKAEVARDVAAEKAQIATEALRKAKREGETAEKLQQLWVEMEAADDAVKQAQQDLENAQKIAANRAEQIIDQAQERIESESEENSRRVTDVVEGIRDKLRAEADKVVEEGGKVSGEFERQMGIIKTLLEDKVADNKQTYELYHAITSAIAESTKLQKDFLKDITVERAKIAELRTAYENIQAIQKDLGR
jgi:DNA anti-recombination protein RmuC